MTVGPATLSNPGDGFEIRYCDVPPEACLKLVTAVSPVASRILIDGVNVMPQAGRLNTQAAVFPCSQALNVIRFQFRASDGAQIAAPTIAAPAPDPMDPATPPCPTCPATPTAPSVTPIVGTGLVAVPPGTSPTAPPTPVVTPDSGASCLLSESQSLSCAAGQVGNKTQTRIRSSCTGAWSAWTVTYDGCQTPVTKPVVTPPTPSGCPQCVANTTFVQNQNYNPSYPQTWTCAATPPAWATGCPAPCVAPANQTQWVPRSDANCPAGYTGTRTWEAEQSRSASCPAPYGPFNWSSWSDTGTIRNMDTSGCAANCVAPAPETQWVPRSDSNCPAGTSGTRTWEAEQSRSGSCPAPTGPFTWGSWADTGNTRNLSTAGCTPTCTATSQTQWISAAGSCPSGQTGSITWEKEQRNDYSCPSGTWSGWTDTGNVRNTVNTCTAAVCAGGAPFGWQLMCSVNSSMGSLYSNCNGSGAYGYRPQSTLPSDVKTLMNSSRIGITATPLHHGYNVFGAGGVLDQYQQSYTATSLRDTGVAANQDYYNAAGGGPNYGTWATGGWPTCGAAQVGQRMGSYLQKRVTYAGYPTVSRDSWDAWECGCPGLPTTPIPSAGLGTITGKSPSSCVYFNVSTPPAVTLAVTYTGSASDWSFVWQRDGNADGTGSFTPVSGCGNSSSCGVSANGNWVLTATYNPTGAVSKVDFYCESNAPVGGGGKK